MWWILILIISLFILYRLATWNHTVFSDLGIPGPKPWPLIGNFLHLVNYGMTDDEILTKKYGRIFGFFEGMIPVLIIADTECIKMVTVKHFDKFVNRRFFVKQKELDKAVTVLQDDEWRIVRNVMTPTFTSGKLKKIALGIDDCASRLLNTFRKTIESNPVIEIKSEIGTFTMSVIAETLFGVNVDDDPKKAEIFVKHAYRALEDFSFLKPAMLLMFFFPFLHPLANRFSNGFISQESVDFFTAQIGNILKMRRHSSEASKKPNDFLQLLIDAQAQEENNNTGPDNDASQYANGENVKWKSIKKRALTEEEIIANSMLFFLAGYETTTLTIAWIMHLLAINEEVQEKLYNEINSHSDTEDKSFFETISKISYLDQVVNETLRLYPATSRTDRVCNEECIIGSHKIPKGMVVNLAIKAVHYDQEYWIEPKKFDPDRFSPERKHEIQPYSYLPFGLGPRNCIGMRLALLEIKICIVRLLKEFKLLRCEKTEEFPKLKIHAAFPIPKNGLWIKLAKRE